MTHVVFTAGWLAGDKPQDPHQPGLERSFDRRYGPYCMHAALPGVLGHGHIFLSVTSVGMTLSELHESLYVP